jgi:hypothetical protein
MIERMTAIAANRIGRMAVLLGFAVWIHPAIVTHLDCGGYVASSKMECGLGGMSRWAGGGFLLPGTSPRSFSTGETAIRKLLFRRTEGRFAY